MLDPPKKDSNIFYSIIYAHTKHSTTFPPPPTHQSIIFLWVPRFFINTLKAPHLAWHRFLLVWISSMVGFGLTSYI